MPTTTRTGIYYTMDHAEGGGGYTENYQADSYKSGYPVTVSWDDANRFVVDMLGSHRIVAGAIRRDNPEQHIYFPGLYCSALRHMTNLGPPRDESASDDGNLAYSKIRYFAEFDAPLYKVLTDEQTDALTVTPLTMREVMRYVEFEESPGVEAVQRNGLAFEWNYPEDASVDRRPIPEPPAIIMTHRIITLTMHFWPRVPYGAIDYCCQGVNDAAFLLPTGESLDPETVLLQGTEIKRIPRTAADEELWKIKLNLFVRPNGWNRIFNSKVGDYIPVVQKSDHTTPPYPLKDYTILFAGGS